MSRNDDKHNMILCNILDNKQQEKLLDVLSLIKNNTKIDDVKSVIYILNEYISTKLLTSFEALVLSFILARKKIFSDFNGDIL